VIPLIAGSIGVITVASAALGADRRRRRGSNSASCANHQVKKSRSIPWS
jgi:hypothetical protein